MTGFAQVRKTVPSGEFALSVKTVNHRGLDMHLHLPPEMETFEIAMRRTVKGRVARGHLQLSVTWSQTDALAAASSLNRPLLAAYLTAFQQAQREFQLTGAPDLNVAFRVPGMFRTEASPDLTADFESSLVAALEEALDALNRFRERRAARWRRKFWNAARHSPGVGRMEIRSGAVPAFHKRLQERLTELLRAATVEPQRLAQEAALLADRSDISEELIRLKTHAATRATGTRGRRNWQEAGFSAAGNEPRNQHDPLQDWRPRGIGIDHNGTGPGCKIRDRQDSRAIAQPGVVR